MKNGSVSIEPRRTFAATLRRLLDDFGLSDSAVASKCGMKQGTLSKYLNRKGGTSRGNLPFGSIPKQQLEALANVLRVGSETLLSKNNTPQSAKYSQLLESQFEEEFQIAFELSNLQQQREVTALREEAKKLRGAESTCQRLDIADAIIDRAESMLSHIKIGEMRPILLDATLELRTDNSVGSAGQRLREAQFSIFDKLAHIDSFLETDSVDSQTNKELAHLASFDPRLNARHRVRLGDQMKNAARDRQPDLQEALNFFREIQTKVPIVDYVYFRSHFSLSADASKDESEFDEDVLKLRRHESKLKIERPWFERAHIFEGEALANAAAFKKFGNKKYKIESLSAVQAANDLLRGQNNKWQHMEYGVRLWRLPILLLDKGIIDISPPERQTKRRVLVEKVKYTAVAIGSTRIAGSFGG